MKENRYFILDAGGKMTREAEYLLNVLLVHNNHVVRYLTDAPDLLCLQEVDEDEFLEHYKTKDENNN